MIRLCKFSRFPGDPPYVYPNTYCRGTSKGVDYLLIAPAHQQVDLMLALSGCIPEKLAILYILIESQMDNEVGRYQCPYPLTRAETARFFHRFETFLEQDARHHVWILSVANPGSLIVYDCRNVLYAYGPLDDYVQALQSRGFQPAPVEIPVPHALGSNPAFVDEEKAIMGYWDWKRFPLQEQDH